MLRWGELRREPFRLLFPLGAFFGCLGVGHWLGYGAGWSATYSGFYHASMQVGLYMTCFVVGFLLTALPRFSSTPPASHVQWLAVLMLLVVQTASLSAGRWIIAESAWVGLLMLVALFAGRRFVRQRSLTPPPTEFVWIPIAILFGVAGTVLLIGGQLGGWPAWTLGVGRPMAQQGWLLGIVLGVGGFMAPRLMGRDVWTSATSGLAPARVQQVRRRRMLLHGVAGACLLASFFIEGHGAIRWAYLVRAVVVTAELTWTTQCVRPPRVKDRYVILLWYALWAIILGVWGAALWPRYRVAALHIVFLGGFSLMTFAVGAMVVLSHSGQGERLRHPLWVLRVVGWGIGGALVLRLIAESQPETFFRWLSAASVLWLIAGVSWILFVLPLTLRPLSPGAFESVHEAAKRKLLSSR